MSRTGVVLGDRRHEGSRASATLTFFAWSFLLIVAVVATTIASSGGARVQWMTLLLLALFTGALTVWCAIDARFDRQSLLAIVTLLVLSRVIAFAATPLLEDDFFRYLWDGYVTGTTGRPYSFPPSHYFGDSAVPEMMQAALNGINHPDVPTIYGIVWQLVFAVSYFIAPGALWPIKLTLLIVEIVMLIALSRNGVAHRWLLCWIAHPLILQESALSAHPDVLIGATLLAATLMWQRGSERSGAALVAVAVAMKASALVVLPLFWLRKSGRIGFDLCAISVATIALLYLPIIVTTSGSELSALATFGQQWTFAVVALRWRVSLRAQTAAISQDESITIATPILAITFALLMLSPAVNPWYWLWALPIALLRRDRLSLLCWVAASVSLLSYTHAMDAALANSSAFSFRVPLWATIAQLTCVAIAAFVLYRQRESRA
jgi:alpha-1,6-mannosyltransferase